MCSFTAFSTSTIKFNPIFNLSHNHLTEARNNLHQTIENFVKFFESHQLTINANKTEFICFSKPSKNEVARSHTLKVKIKVSIH